MIKYYIICLLLSISTFSIGQATNSNLEKEKKIILDSIEYHKSSISRLENKLRLVDTQLNKEKLVNTNNFVSINNFSIYQRPSMQSNELMNFKKDSVQIQDYQGGLFLVKSKDGKNGYVNEYAIPNYSKEKVILLDAATNKAKANNINFYIHSAGIEDVNSASGVNFFIEWYYANDQKPIKYIYFTVLPYNNVGDVQKCSIAGHSSYTAQITGPVNGASKINNSIWNNAWYNKTIACLKITKVEIKYMDGTSYTYLSDLPKIINNYYTNNCN